MSKKEKQRKELHLDDEVVRILSKLAIDSPQRNFKNYVEQMLVDRAMLEKLKELSK